MLKLAFGILILFSVTSEAKVCSADLMPIRLRQIRAQDIAPIREAFIAEGCEVLMAKKYLALGALAKNEDGASEIFIYSVMSGGKLIGDVGIMAYKNSAEVLALFPFIKPGERWGLLTYHIFKEYEGNGLATRALAAAMRRAKERMRYDGLIADVDPRNLRSQRVLEKNSFNYFRLHLGYLQYQKALSK